MYKRFCCVILFCCALLVSMPAFADHVFGGFISLTQIDKPSAKFKITLNLYIDMVHIPPLEDDFFRNNPLKVKTFRKSDNKEVDLFYVAFERTRDIVYDNSACAILKNLKTTEYIFSTTKNLDLTKYEDADGYYLVYEICCRNAELDNIVLPNEVGMTFYTEFPTLSVNGTPISYSSPEFPALNGDYICVNKAFKYDFKATDVDGDILKYSLVTPYKGHNNLGDPGKEAEAAPYALVGWMSGYSESTSIKGNPPLNINATSGEITVTATTKGLFVFSVQCEEYRNGKRIGLVRHDFQLPVEECSKTTPPVPIISHSGSPVDSIEICKGEIVLLETEDNSNWAFQWKKDGTNITGSKSNTASVKEEGKYAVIKSLKNTCSNDTISKEVKIKFRNTFKPEINYIRTSACLNDTIHLSTAPKSGFTFEWYLDGILISNTNALIANQSGDYILAAKTNLTNCKIDEDTVKLSFTNQLSLPPPLNASIEICKGDSTKLETIDKPDFNYQWFFKGTAINKATNSDFWAKEEGEYQVEMKNNKGCEGKSDPYKIVYSSTVPIRFDSLLYPLCINENRISLYATPTGGTFTGIGINGKFFDPKIAGVGRHPVTYTIASNNGCSGKFSRVVIVVPLPSYNLTRNWIIQPDESIRLDLRTNETNLLFHWSPHSFLDDHNLQNPTVTPPSSIEYKVNIMSGFGCSVTDSVNIIVRSSFFVPNVFTPNNDGINDLLEIKNIEKFPDIEVFIYNRWGEIIFYSKGYAQGWNGTYHGTKVTPGIYIFKIKPNLKDIPIVNGQITVLY